MSCTCDEKRVTAPMKCSFQQEGVIHTLSFEAGHKCEDGSHEDKRPRFIFMVFSPQHNICVEIRIVFPDDHEPYVGSFWIHREDKKGRPCKYIGGKPCNIIYPHGYYEEEEMLEFLLRKGEDTLFQKLREILHGYCQG